MTQLLIKLGKKAHYFFQPITGTIVKGNRLIIKIPYPKQFNKDGTFSAIFIRAPLIVSVNKDVDILCKIDEEIIAVQKNKILGTTFHPELSNDHTWHKYFASLI